MTKTKIEWTEQTWNPIVGCSVVSPGCTNCYAMRDAWRKHHNPAIPHYHGLTKRVNGKPVWTGKIAQAPERILLEPLKRKKPTTYFVNSMGDLFHKDVPDEFIDRVFAVMALCPQHTFQVLTKRAERMREYCGDDATLGRVVSLANEWLGSDGSLRVWHKADGLRGIVLPNCWLGVSAERQEEWDERKEHLHNTPAFVHFASFEPLLGPIIEPRPLSEFIQWAIVGGESGPRARPMHPQWARDIRDQCEAAGVSFFFKQWGEWGPTTSGSIDPDPMERWGKKRAGRKLDGREHNGMPEMRP